MAKPEFLMLAHDYNPLKHHVNGWFLSEKIDGQRALWDGGISRGVPKSQVPWANNAKDERYLVQPTATGLWSRYGNVIHAPNWFLDLLPPFPLDGELTLGRGTWQETASVIKKISPDETAWKDIIYYVFDSPQYPTLLADRRVSQPNFTKQIKGSFTWAAERIKLYNHPSRTLDYDGMYRWLVSELSCQQVGNVRVLEQVQLPFMTQETEEIIQSDFHQIVESGGEGIILRNYLSKWFPERSYDVLKFKPDKDAEGTVLGYIWGKETDKGSKLLGLMGALVLDFNGKRLELSGFSNEEREMIPKPRILVNTAEPTAEFAGRSAETWHNTNFPIGSKITFKYRELSRDGIPKEARFSRVRAAGT